jgi:hypothetical protein
MNTKTDSGHSESLRSTLLDSEPLAPDRLQHLEKQIGYLSDYRLGKGMRLWWSIGLGSSILFGIFGTAVTMSNLVDWPLRIVWLLYTIGNLGFACFATWLLRRGRAEPVLFFWFGVVICMLAAGCFAALLYRAAASNTNATALWVGFAEFCVLIDVLLILYGRIKWMHLSTKEHLLRLELLVLDLKTKL